MVAGGAGLTRVSRVFDNYPQRGVRRYSHSGLRYVKLPGDAVLVGRNPRKGTRWAEMVRKGRKVAWAIRGDEYIARVTDGEVEMLGHRSDE